MLGSLTEAEDVVQEACARWYAMTGRQQYPHRQPRRLADQGHQFRICLNLLGSARARRETYTGTWLPEPLPDPAEWPSCGPGPRPTRPTGSPWMSRSFMAFLVVLDAMTPAERVAFILHDVFGYPFTEVAEITGRTPAACRKLALHRPPPCPRRPLPRHPHRPAGQHRQGLQAGLGSRRHRRPRQPARSPRHRDR